MTSTPRRATGRVSGVPRRVGRIMEQSVQSDSIYNDSLDVDKDGRLGARLAPDSGLELTREGIRLAPSARGEPNRPQLDRIDDIIPTGTSAQRIIVLEDKINSLLTELRRTKNMRSGGQ